jgi:hypothetical protein
LSRSSSGRRTEALGTRRAVVVVGGTADPPACSAVTVLFGAVDDSMVGARVGATGGAVGDTTFGSVVTTAWVGRELGSEGSDSVALDGEFAIDDEVGSACEISPACID